MCFSITLSDEAFCKIGYDLLLISPKPGFLSKITSEITGYFGKKA